MPVSPLRLFTNVFLMNDQWWQWLSNAMMLIVRLKRSTSFSGLVLGYDEMSYRIIQHPQRSLDGQPSLFLVNSSHLFLLGRKEWAWCWRGARAKSSRSCWNFGRVAFHLFYPQINKLEGVILQGRRSSLFFSEWQFKLSHIFREEISGFLSLLTVGSWVPFTAFFGTPSPSKTLAIAY